MFEINISACPLRSLVRFPVKPIPHVIERVTLRQRSFHRGSGFLLHTLQTAQYCRANNVLVDAPLSIQYFILNLKYPYRKSKRPPGTEGELISWRKPSQIQPRSDTL
jgi:hypothetical protein